MDKREIVEQIHSLMLKLIEEPSEAAPKPKKRGRPKKIVAKAEPQLAQEELTEKDQAILAPEDEDVQDDEEIDASLTRRNRRPRPKPLDVRTGTVKFCYTEAMKRYKNGRPNHFLGSPLSKSYQNDRAIDKKLLAGVQITERAASRSIEVKCSRCDRIFTTSPQLLYVDPEDHSIVAICDKCQNRS